MLNVDVELLQPVLDRRFILAVAEQAKSQRSALILVLHHPPS